MVEVEQSVKIDGPSASTPSSTPAEDGSAGDRQDTVTTVAPQPTVAPDEPLSDDEVAEILEDLEANGFCDPRDVEDEGLVTAMHFVVQGQIQSPCYVDTPEEGSDPRLDEAWALLTSITPIELVDDISLLAGYERCDACETLAFVTQLDEAATFFIVAVDVLAAVEDPDELRLTMMHELTHVFAQRPVEQLIVVDNPTGCDTFFNGVGCFTEDSYLWAWIQEFWPPEIRDTLPSDGSVGSDDEADERCSTDRGYTGSYAAVHPEEDFAETFSAYVFDVDVDPALEAKMAFFDRYPEFVEIREAARALGYDDTEANFEGCG